MLYYNMLLHIYYAVPDLALTRGVDMYYAVSNLALYYTVPNPALTGGLDKIMYYAISNSALTGGLDKMMYYAISNSALAGGLDFLYYAVPNLALCRRLRLQPRGCSVGEAFQGDRHHVPYTELRHRHGGQSRPQGR